MAIAFAHISIHSRTKGHSAVAASAYRTASLLHDERTGETHDYRHKREVVYAELLLPEIAHASFQNREYLWNQVEHAEKRRDAQVCKDIVLALPKELDLTQHIELTKRFAQTHFIANGIPADIAIHDHDDGNPHAHILIATRRLERDGFSKYKARDLNPAFAKGRIVEKDYWGERWRDAQNEYFIEKNIDLTVDINHVIAERHQGKIRGKDNHFLKEENRFIQQERQALARKNVETIIQHLSQQHSVFTKRDVQNLLFKTFRDAEKPEEYLSRVEQVMAHNDVINLGENDRGKICFTTRHQYIQEARLRSDIEKMMKRNHHVLPSNIESLAHRYTLSEEQREALKYIAQAPDISVVIGRPGTGKSYLLKPVKDYFEADSYQVIGASLSSKVAKSLQSETGIASSTMASLNFRLNNNKLRLTNKHVIIIDEAGMVDFNNMSVLLNKARRAGSKVLLIGDPDQLKPIQKGEIFRGIASITGYIELDNIKRQQDLDDRQASMNMAKGNIDAALEHYHAKGAVHLHETPKDASEQLVADWQKNVNKDNLQDSILLAFTRKAVADLNDKARQALKDKNILGGEEVIYQGFEKELNISTGERLLFRQNDKTLGVRNGDLGTVTAVQEKRFQIKLDSGELLDIPSTYQAIDYGYALTVHKSQGMTAKDVSVLIDSKYWDKHLSFVAMTRHKIGLKVYADKMNHPTLNDLKRTMSRSVTRDNVIDWPLDFAIRAGFNPDKLMGKAVNHLADIGHKIKNTFNYVVHYEAYLKDRTRHTEQQHKRKIAHCVSEYLDERSILQKEIAKFEKQAKAQRVDQSELEGFEALYAKSLERDKKAYALLTFNKPSFDGCDKMNKAVETLKHDASRYERYLAVKSIAEYHNKTTMPDSLIKASAKIDLSKDYVHIVREAAKHQKTSRDLYQQIEGLQKLSRQMRFDEMKKDYPVLAEYDELHRKRARVNGYEAERLDKVLTAKAKEIVSHQPLDTMLKKELPKFAAKLITSIKAHEIERDR